PPSGNPDRLGFQTRLSEQPAYAAHETNLLGQFLREFGGIVVGVHVQALLFILLQIGAPHEMAPKCALLVNPLHFRIRVGLVLIRVLGPVEKMILGVVFIAWNRLPHEDWSNSELAAGGFDEFYIPLVTAQDGLE